ncbi:CBL-interacting serine/threonine-protein kinase 20 [Dionaea muscipula]
MDKKGFILMHKYELGRLLGQGTFAKVYYARCLTTGQSVAIKMLDKEKILKVGLIDQIKREISVMRLVRHPNVVQLYEVMASKTKIYFAMEYARGGELFNKISKGRLREDVARKYFQQLISAIDFCHSRGVYHRDLKPENLLVDEKGNLKISDFGLSALWESRKQDGLLHTTCGTPAYVAPEVINKRGYDGAKADIWSCGVVLYVLLAGFLPFHDSNLMELYRKICRGQFKCPQWFPQDVRKLLFKILDPNPYTRTTVAKLMEDCWFRKGLISSDQQALDRDEITSAAGCCKSEAEEEEPSTPRDVRLAFQSPDLIEEDYLVGTSSEEKIMKPTSMNAFDIISLSPGFNLSNLFEKDANHMAEARFTTTQPASAIVSRFERIAEMERFKIEKLKDGMVKLRSVKEGRKGLLAIDAEIFEIAPSLHVVEVTKAAGDTLEYNNFCNRDLKPALKDIAWTWQ